MSLQEKIGFLGGGMMAEALIKGILQGGLVAAEQIYVVDPVAERRELLQKSYKINASAEYGPVLAADIIILAVKPQSMDALLADCRGDIDSNNLLISIAAGITLSFIEDRLAKECRVIRVMPNTPALVLEGASALSGGQNVSAEDMNLASTIFNAIGLALVMPEAALDGVTGLSGSGPAYVFSFLEAMIDGGLKVGLPREAAEKLAQQTILGSMKLAMSRQDHPAQLKAMVTSPGGTTIAGLHELERGGFRVAIMDAIEAATRRSQELGSVLK